MSRVKITLAAIILLGLAVRLYQSAAWLGFDYDQEINAQIARSIVVDQKLTLIGPETSVGGMFVGSLFNYVIALFFYLSKMDPAGTIWLNILISALTIFMSYHVGRLYFSSKVGLISALIYSLSRLTVSYDRVLWNPTPIPLMILSVLYFYKRHLESQKWKPLLLAGFFAGTMFHLHFTAVFVLAAFAIIIAIQAWHRKDPKPLLIALTGPLLLLSPLVLFDLRHDFLNFNHLISFLISSQTISTSYLDLFVKRSKEIIDVLRQIIFSGQNQYQIIFATASSIGIIFLSLRNIFKNKSNFFLHFSVFFLICLFGLTLYKGPLPAQYLLFLFPLFIVSMSHFLCRLSQSTIGKIFVLFSFIVLVIPAVGTVTYEKSDLSLNNKKLAIAYILNDAKSVPKIDYNASLGLNTGFSYLIWYYSQGKHFSKDSPREYFLVIPKTIVPKNEITAAFGSIGIIKKPQP